MEKEDDPKQRHRKGVGADLILPVAAALYAGYYVYTIQGFPWEAQINGTFIAAVLWALVAIFIVRIGIRLWRNEVTLRMTEITTPRDKLPMRLGFIGLTVLSIFLVDWLGFTLTVFLYLLASMSLLGVRRVRQLTLISAIAASLGYIFFIIILETKLPAGPIEHLLTRVL